MSAIAPSGTVVPFVDLGRMHAPLAERLLDEVRTLVASGAFVNGPAVAEFEQAFADYCGSAYAVGLASGLDALRLGLLAAGLRPGDEVIVPALTFVATVEAVTQAGGRPVLADVGAEDACIDPEAVSRCLGARTRFLLPVHLYGQMADMTALVALANENGLAVVEDACQAHGAVRSGIRAGTSGRCGAFSFYPGKNLGAMGDAGALVTDDAELAATVLALREHGQRAKYRHELEGFTARLDTIQAIVLQLKLPLLDAWNAERVEAAAGYDELLQGVGDLVLPRVAPGSEHVWHLYVVRTAEPERLGRYLAGRGIASGRHYPIPVHLTEAYAALGYAEGAFPVAEAYARECLSLPIFPGITREEVERVAVGVRSYFESSG